VVVDILRVHVGRDTSSVDDLVAILEGPSFELVAEDLGSLVLRVVEALAHYDEGMLD
jgi:hypothetical protein